MNMLLLFALLGPHDEKVVVHTIEVKGAEVTWTVNVGIVRLGKEIRFPATPMDLSEVQLQSMKLEVAKFLLARIALDADGREATPEAGRLEPGYDKLPIPTGEPYIGHVIQQFVFRAGAPVQRLHLQADFDDDDFPSTRSLVFVRWPDRDGDKSLPPHTLAGKFRLDVVRAMPQSSGRTALEFVKWGMHHIFIGFDHIAFLLALLLAATRLGEMVKIVSSFTVAHSITLLLAALDVVRVPPAITEAMIAASIVYVAAENYVLKEAKHRWALTFAFGLIHGLGFAGVLQERLEGLDGIVLPVVSFNIGVELGQIAILLVAFPSLAFLARAKEVPEAGRRRLLLRRVGSAPLGLLGLGWLLFRLFQWKWLSWLG